MVRKIFLPVEVFFPSQAGGPANTIYWVTKNLPKHGLETFVVATDKGIQAGIPLNRWVEIDGGKVIYVKTRFLNFPVYQTLLALFNFYKADIVQISSIFFPTAFLTALFSRLLKKKILWSPRGELDPAALDHSKLRKRPILWCLKKLIGTYPVFHSTCLEETGYIKNVFGKAAKVVQIPNYIEIPPPKNCRKSNYFLYIGRIHPKKAIDNLIRAVSMSGEFMKSDYILKIAGTGKPEFETDLRRLVEELDLKEKIEFAGQIEGDEKQTVLAEAFWTVMPSHTENFGVVVLESLAQSTPVVASKGTPWEDLEKEKIGFWVDNSPASLARKIDEILRMSVEEYEEVRSGCRAFVERRYDVRENIDRWIDLYEGL